jgi:hypothetical protein
MRRGWNFFRRFHGPDLEIVGTPKTKKQKPNCAKHLICLPEIVLQRGGGYAQQKILQGGMKFLLQYPDPGVTFRPIAPGTPGIHSRNLGGTHG